MKKLSTIIMAIALVLGLSQCKKQETPTTPNDNDGKVYITVNVDNDGGRHHVEPSVGAYAFTNGDKLYVGNDHRYVGTLTYNNGVFTGGVEFAQEHDYLHFYFVGGKNPELNSDDPELMAGSTSSFTVTIDDQSTNLPILSYGCSDQLFSYDPNVRYSTTLRNKCALVKIGFVGGTTEAVKVSDMLTKATIDFESQGITPDPNTTGDITLYSENEIAKWAVLLPQEDPITEFDVYIGDASAPTYTIPGPYTISNNGYINDIKIEDVAYPFGKVIGEDGNFYDNVDDAWYNHNVMPMAVVVYVGDDCKLAIELHDLVGEEGPVALNWGTAVWAAGEDLNNFIGSPIQGGTWHLPTMEDWEKMSSGNYGNSVYDFTRLLSALNNAGAAPMNGSYWTGTDDGDNATCIDFINPNNNSLFAIFNNIPKDNNVRYVRPVLVF